MILKYEIWSRRRKRHGVAYSKESLEKAHNERKEYCLTYLEDDGVTPYCFLEIRDKYFFVGFLDNLKRLYLSYSFSEEKKNRLFLNSVAYHQYEADSDDSYKITNYNFLTDGTFKVVERDFRTNEKVIYEAKNKIDVNANWEDYPEFGKYEKLIVKERGMNHLLKVN